MNKKKLFRASKYGFLIIISFLSLFPLLWMFIAATNKSVDVLAGTLIPGKNLIENFKVLTVNTNLYRAMWNSFKYAAVTTLASLLISSLAGYGFEIYHDRGKDMLMKILLLSMMVPFAVIMVPLYMLFGDLGLLNTTAGFALPTVSTAFLIFLFRQSSRNFPHEVIEASRLDGLTEIGIFFKMFIPIMRSTYAAAAVITFMNAWNNYLWPLIIMQKDSAKTMPLLISNLTAGYTTDYGVLMLAVGISILPTLILFLALQKNFAEGVTGSAK
ncbi:carbohydrate ABC transporter permease [Halanaerobium congolense]|jgi:lactose/L-arabinose transport system permease protein|uniref:Lactose/L-arabinose transport system permease protein n=1 Tax=Halanaerobium congolense TaxID=54121 RepID=A0A1G6KG20_9FIRM|nr:carbohydrate ABC transporter permease [Halanaerobium congolense]SDC29877.1 lactose/L-arabinose transport system permease protein [Halanaerobium congolense]